MVKPRVTSINCENFRESDVTRSVQLLRLPSVWMSPHWMEISNGCTRESLILRKQSIHQPVKRYCGDWQTKICQRDTQAITTRPSWIWARRFVCQRIRVV